MSDNSPQQCKGRKLTQDEEPEDNTGNERQVETSSTSSIEEPEDNTGNERQVEATSTSSIEEPEDNTGHERHPSTSTDAKLLPEEKLQIKRLTGSYLQKLLKKAEVSCNGNFNSVTFLYRNKPQDYFTNLKDEVMPKTMKDNCGDKLSPINGRVEGVFFCVSLYRGELPTISPFGDTRICIPIKALFDESTNLYFTDFYCFKREAKPVHYVTLVLTKQGSDADKFCQDKRLPLLDPQGNPFLKRESDSTFYTTSTSDLYVEVFYTEDVDISSLRSVYGSSKVYMTKTDTYGRGHSTVGGLPKNECCSDCKVKARTLERLLASLEL